MKRAFHAALVATALTGVIVAVMPLVPAAIRDVVALGILAGWLVTLVYVAGRALARLRATWQAAIGCAGIGLAVLSGMQLELIRLFAGRPALTWNVDWRFHLSHTQAIIRTGDLSQALDYSGAPIAYHVGPAWLAAAATRLLDLDPTLVLFGLTPLLAVLAFAVGAVQFLRALGVSVDSAFAATGVTMTVPALIKDPRTVYYVFPEGILNAEFWVFSPSLMLNSLLALAVGMCALALIVDRESGRISVAVGALALASVVILKPPYFAGLGTFVGLLGIDRVWRDGAGESARGRVLIASVAALATAVLMLALLPHGGLFFGKPLIAPGATGVKLATGLRNSVILILAVLALVAVLSTQGRAVAPRRALRSMLAAGAGLACVVLFLAMVLVPVRAEVLARVRAMGAEEWDATHEHRELRQALLPLDVLAVLSASGLLAATAPALAGGPRVGLGVLAGVVVLSPLPYLAYQAAEPRKGYEAVEDVHLFALLRAIPDDGRLAIASDLADPAEDYWRPLRGLQFTALSGRPFYASVLAYAHFVEPDARARLDTLRSFFGAAWSPWHTQWLVERNIGTVLVNDRCRPAWFGEPTPGLELVAARGTWSAFRRAEPAAGQAAIMLRTGAPARWMDLTPAHGRSDCLRWRWHDSD